MGYIEDFERWIGQTESPEIFFKYASISLIAACLAQRCWTHWQAGNRHIRVYPNLYTLLLATSGVGKSHAISSAMDLLRRTPYHDIINLYEGKLTAPAMYEAMFPGRNHPERAFIYVVNDELANDIGIGEYANQFVTSLTRMYLCAPFQEATVTRGTTCLPDPYCVNWLAGTTRAWMRDSLRRDAILGGFFARVVVIEAKATGRRLPPGRPVPDWWPVLDTKMVEETTRLLRMSGEFTFTPEAVETYHAWYMGRPFYEEEDPLFPTQNREESLMLKFSQILSASEGETYEITHEHVAKAVQLVSETSRTIPELADFLSQGARHTIYKELQDVVRKGGVLSLEKLAKIAYQKGIQTDELGKLRSTWVEAGLVEMEGGSIKWKK